MEEKKREGRGGSATMRVARGSNKDRPSHRFRRYVTRDKDERKKKKERRQRDREREREREREGGSERRREEGGGERKRKRAFTGALAQYALAYTRGL